MENADLGIPKKSREICSLSVVRRVAAMLDLDTNTFEEGDLLPKGWHFFMLAGETRKSDLRADGFPGLGVPIPDFNLPRLLLGGRTVIYQGDILIGSVVEKTSFIKEIKEKNGASGRMAIVTIQHELRLITDEKPAIIETQTYIFMEGNKTSLKPSPIERELKNEVAKQFTPDETLLFQYSALGFNSHKIHLDINYAQNIEGLPDLVVNGGLATLLMTEFIRKELTLNLSEIKVKHLSPLFCNRPLIITFEEGKGKIYDNDHVVAVEIEFK